MALHHLPKEVQSLISASSHVNTFKTAIEELVYNSLDAESKSIAIRIDIQEYKIQVIDNGLGISKNNFKGLGQRYMTSKTVDLATFKSDGKKYGYKGDFLANAIAVAHTVKITSRYKDAEETWEKTFIKGKDKPLIQAPKRPSEGTTIEIKGYLYNLNIQRKTIDTLNEITRIKQFLEQISIVHNDISLSLRDDCKNEIIFSIHKKRDVYQTLSNLFNINKGDIQELQVQKNDYEVKALIGIKGKESNQKWIYINGKPLADNSKLHDIVNNNFRTYLRGRDKLVTKCKLKAHLSKPNEEIFSTNMPFYFLFITCPRKDYDISNTPKQSVLEFKEWEQMTKLLQKVVKFYAGEPNSKVVTKAQLSKNTKPSDILRQDTRKQVKVIMDKILGKQSRQNTSAFVKNGVKGQLIRRKLQPITSHKNHEILKSCNKKKRDRLPSIKKIETRDDDGPSYTKHYLKNNGVNRNMNTKLDISNNSRIGREIQCEKKENLHASIMAGITNDGLSNNRKCHTNRSSEDVQKCKKIHSKSENRVSKPTTKLLGIKPFREHSSHRSINLLREQYRSCKSNYILAKIKEKSFKTTYDLVQTIINSQKDTFSFKNMNYDNLFNKPIRSKPNNMTKCYFNSSFRTELTFQSHIRERNQMSIINKNDTYRRFITEESKDNFKEPNKFISNMGHKNIRNENLKQQITRFYDINLKHTIEESYTIEFTKSNSIDHVEAQVLSSFDKQKTLNINRKGKCSITEKVHRKSETDNLKNCDIFNLCKGDKHDEFWSNKMNSESFIHRSPQQPFGNTYTISMKRLNQTNNVELDGGTEWIPQALFPYKSTCRKGEGLDDVLVKENNFNVLFVSNSQNTNTSKYNDQDKEPLEICETVLDSCQSNEIDSEKLQPFTNNQLDLQSQNKSNTNVNEYCDFEKDKSVGCSKFFGQEEINNTNHITPRVTINVNSPGTKDNPIAPSNNFNIKDRLTFLPKGMSQIFEICHSKTACEYNLDKEYFKNNIYANFVNDVDVNTEVYEPIIQNFKDFTTKHIDKVINKQNKDNASLIFDGISLKEAIVLGQVDQKFIVAVMKEKPTELDERIEYLIMFDQHAVHERIKLENNLEDYLNDDHWKSVSLENIKLNLTKEEILYLHNYSEKFWQLGLQWDTIDDNEVSFKAIPEAILGKNPREVDKVLIAVKKLVAEEVHMLKNQKGCISMYPQTIMDLVFSEACRYAIKFGDRLSKNQCCELLESLSKCKVPFQCAHGRPVMAVIMDLQNSVNEYKVDFSKVKQFATRKP